MAIEKVREYFKTLGVDNRIIEFEVSSATVSLAAKALRCDEARIAKSLTFRLNDKVIIVVTAGDTKVDNSKYKKTFKTKAKMLNAEETLKFVGHAVGGVCPFSVKDGVDIFLDESLKRFVTVFPACGSSNSAIELSIEELEQYSNFVSWIDVCKVCE